MTEWVVRGRGGGKTTEAIKWVLAEPQQRLLVVPDTRQREYVSRAFDLPPRMILVPSRGGENLRGYRFSDLAVDNVEMMVPWWFRPVGLATVTGEHSDWPDWF